MLRKFYRETQTWNQTGKLSFDFGKALDEEDDSFDEDTIDEKEMDLLDDIIDGDDDDEDDERVLVGVADGIDLSALEDE